jgi:hypothetical protein
MWHLTPLPYASCGRNQRLPVNLSQGQLSFLIKPLSTSIVLVV